MGCKAIMFENILGEVFDQRLKEKFKDILK